MTHPDQTILALYAGQDLGWFRRRRTERHLARCRECRGEVQAFASARDHLVALNELPAISWNRLAIEMKANIRLGLAAGECVRTDETRWRETPLFSRARAVVAFASVVVLLFAGLVLEHPAPSAPKYDGVVVQTTANGIQVREGGQALRLLHAGAQNVQYSVGAQGSMRARYVDPETGYVTINDVYAD